ncbi:hypothetical protein M407DRAFT_66689 [Tulasnella calospora MUT 4182]|uniref:Uncharacterized protein n=1 Tax=Tulasnella calospora MUT 4182 TaxID=1051891 RepID=A0A0C3QV72_9AGAM|nr:hypothetical protein M407DRAFT_66689 [Tulasnella calospora MUT 4182]
MTLLPAEMARVRMLEQEKLKNQKFLTVMTDGWDDAQHRSVYGTVVVERGKYPTILGLENLTGKRGSAANIGAAVRKSMKEMAVDPKQIIAMVTDDPTVMGAVRRDMEKEYPWIITIACFEHKLNGAMGRVSSFSEVKPVISKNARIVSFFTSSHYWGGELNKVAASQGVNRKLKKHTETRWYSLILLCSSVIEHRSALEILCRREDAIRKVDNLSPVATDVLQTVRDSKHWDLTFQLVRFCKPIVDAIGRIESRDASLADCMLELLRCAREISHLSPAIELGDSLPFSFHAKAAFNREFTKLNTDIHFLALYLHPLCRRLAVSNAPRSRKFKEVCVIAGTLAKKLGWTQNITTKLLSDLQEYHACRPPFTGGTADGAAWWRELPGVSATEHPLKGMALIIFAIVPHTAEVERVFSSLGGFHSPRRSRLSVENLEMLGKLRSHYVGLLHEMGRTKDRRHHTHSRIPKEPGVDANLVSRLIQENVTDALDADQAARELREVAEIRAEMDEELTVADIDRAFAELELEKTTENANTREIDALEVYSMDDLRKVDEGMAPKSVEDDLSALTAEEGGSTATWNLETLLTKAGIA